MADTGQVARYKSALDRSVQQYQQMIQEMQSAKTAAGELSPEYAEIVNLYRPEGGYGTAAKTEVSEQLQAGLGAEQAALVRSGMSSGSMAGNIRSRYARTQAQEFAKIEEGRTDKLSTALSALAAAKEARAGRVQTAYTTTADLIRGFKEPTVGEFESGEDVAAANRASQEWSTIYSTQEAKKRQAAEIAANAAEEET